MVRLKSAEESIFLSFFESFKGPTMFALFLSASRE